MKHTLEGSRAFPYIAWTTLIVFAVFTYYLAMELRETAAYLGDKMDNNVQALEEV